MPAPQLLAQVGLVILFAFLVLRLGLRRGWRAAAPGAAWLGLVVVLLAASNAGSLLGEPTTTIIRAAGLAIIALVALRVLRGEFRA